MKYTIEEIKQLNRRFRSLRKRNRVVRRRPRREQQRGYQASEQQGLRNDENRTVLVRCGDGCLLLQSKDIIGLFNEPFKTNRK